MKKAEINRIMKFLVTGGSATLIDFCIYFILNKFINISIAKFISMLVSCTFSFLINKGWTFQIKEKTNKAYVIKYAITQGINISVNVATNHFVFYATGKKLVAYVIATATGMTVNFLLQRFFVFNQRGEK